MIFAFLKNIGGPELIIVLVVVLLLFGAKKLPDLARSIGESAKEFRKGVTDDDDDSEAAVDTTAEFDTDTETDAAAPTDTEAGGESSSKESSV